MGARVTIKELPTIGQGAQGKWHLEFLVIGFRYHRPSDAREWYFLEFLVIGSLLVANLCPRRYGRERVIFFAYYGAAWGLGLLSVVLCQRLSGSSNVSREGVSPKKTGGKIT